MLAKIWKKLLLAICIIAILFNITAKLVNRISLEKAISSAPEGVNLREVLNITEEQKTASNYTDSVSKYKTVEEVEAERAAQEAEEQAFQQEVYEQESVEPQVIEESDERTTGGKIIDKVTESITNGRDYSSILN